MEPSSRANFSPDLSKKKRRLVLFLGIAISAVFLWAAVQGTDFALIAHAFLRADWWLVVPIYVLLGLFYWIKAFRWCLLLTPIRETKTREAFPAVMIGFTGNVVLPAQLGELVRTYVVSRQLGLKDTAVFATVVLERMFDFMTILLFLCLGLLIGKAPPNLVTAAYALGAVSLGLLVLALVGAIWTANCVALFRNITRVLPDWLHSKLLTHLEIGARGLDAIKKPSLLGGTAISSIAQWGSMGICIYLAMVALDIEAPLSAGFLLLAVMVAILTLPSSPGYVGPIQFSFALVLERYGVTAGDAIAASVFFHVLSLSMAVVGLYYIRRMGFTFGKIQQAATSR